VKKRSALLVAAGLTLTLIAGGLAVAMGLTGPAASTAVPGIERRSAPEPIVRTVRRTVTVHKQADAKAGEVVRVAASGAPAVSDAPDPSHESEIDDHDDGEDHDEDRGDHEDDDHDEDRGDDD
jgi:hypothetical protein